MPQVNHGGCYRGSLRCAAAPLAPRNVRLDRGKRARVHRNASRHERSLSIHPEKFFAHVHPIADLKGSTHEPTFRPSLPIRR